MPDKNITNDITYNFLNLPEQVIQDGNPVTYTYRADGTKIHKLFEINGQSIDTDYIDGFVYTTPYSTDLEATLLDNPQAALAGQAEALQLTDKAVIKDPGGPIKQPATTPNFFPTAEGFYDYDNFRYIYQYKDHLGNVRLSFTNNPDDGSAEVVSSNDYYPFGLNFINIHARQSGHTVYNPSVSFENWKYQGQELQETGFYQFKWRNYDPTIGRFFNVDPLSEKYPYNSTYAFQENKLGKGRELEGLELGEERGDEMESVEESQGEFYNAGALNFEPIPPENSRADDALDFLRGSFTETDPNNPWGLVKPTSDPNYIYGTTEIPEVVVIGSKNNTAKEEKTEKASTLMPGPYAKEGVSASKGKSRNFPANERAEINKQGNENGCHTCGNKSPGTKSGNFIPDHQPPNSLVPDNTPQTLYPHCKSCSASQGGTLSAMKRAEKIQIKPGDAGPVN